MRVVVLFFVRCSPQTNQDQSRCQSFIHCNKLNCWLVDVPTVKINSKSSAIHLVDYNLITYPIPWRIRGSMPYIVCHLPSIYPSHVSVYTIHTDPMGIVKMLIVITTPWFRATSGYPSSWLTQNPRKNHATSARESRRLAGLNRAQLNPDP